MPARRTLHPLAVVAVLAVAILAVWGLGNLSAPRTQRQDTGADGAAPGSSRVSPAAGAAVEETRKDAALALSQRGHLVLLNVLGPAGGAAHALGLSPDGTKLVSGDEWGSLRLWDVGCDTPRVVRTFDAHNSRVVTVAWSPDGHRVASAGRDDVVLWDPSASRETLRITRRLRTSRFDLAFSPDGSCLYTTGSATGLDVLDLTSGKSQRTLVGERPPLDSGPKAPIGQGYRAEAIAVAPDGSWIAAAVHRDPLQIIDARSGHLITRLTGLEQLATYVTATSDGSLLAISKGTLHVWETSTWAKVATIKGPSGRVATADGKTVICTIPEASTLTIWNLQDGTLLDEIEVGSKPLSLAVRGRAIWVGCEDGTIRYHEHRP